jgi:hypothetical protein
MFALQTIGVSLQPFFVGCAIGLLCMFALKPIWLANGRPLILRLNHAVHLLSLSADLSQRRCNGHAYSRLCNVADVTVMRTHSCATWQMQRSCVPFYLPQAPRRSNTDDVVRSAPPCRRRSDCLGQEGFEGYDSGEPSHPHHQPQNQPGGHTHTYRTKLIEHTHAHASMEIKQHQRAGMTVLIGGFAGSCRPHRCGLECRET